MANVSFEEAQVPHPGGFVFTPVMLAEPFTDAGPYDVIVAGARRLALLTLTSMLTWRCASSRPDPPLVRPIDTTQNEYINSNESRSF